ncbi:hypothetical protein JZU54_00120, partial [bacterium]|nr:hypothetical protein [bacterium]
LYLHVYNAAWKNHQAFLSIKTNLQAETYLASDKQARLDVLNALPEAIITAFVGGRPTTFQDYITGSQKFSDLFSQIRGINMPVYEEAGAPSQIYFLTLYGAYEVPFAWWCKCSWLGGWPMGKDPIDSSTCGWHMPNGTLGQSTVFGAFDDRLSSLFDISPATRVMTPTTTKTLLKLLVQLPGIVTQTLLDNALADYRARRNAWMARLADKARRITFTTTAGGPSGTSSSACSSSPGSPTGSIRPPSTWTTRPMRRCATRTRAFRAWTPRCR